MHLAVHVSHVVPAAAGVGMSWLQPVVYGIAAIGQIALGYMVYAMTKAQNRATRESQRRSERIEHQKFRLSLLDRRLAVIDAIEAASAGFIDGVPDPRPAMDLMAPALRTALVVFDESVAQEIRVLQQRMAVLGGEYQERCRANEQAAEKGEYISPGGHRTFGDKMTRLKHEVRLLLDWLEVVSRISEPEPLPEE